MPRREKKEPGPKPEEAIEKAPPPNYDNQRCDQYTKKLSNSQIRKDATPAGRRVYLNMGKRMAHKCDMGDKWERLVLDALRSGNKDALYSYGNAGCSHSIATIPEDILSQELRDNEEEIREKMEAMHPEQKLKPKIKEFLEQKYGRRVVIVFNDSEEGVTRALSGWVVGFKATAKENGWPYEVFVPLKEPRCPREHAPSDHGLLFAVKEFVLEKRCTQGMTDRDMCQYQTDLIQRELHKRVGADYRKFQKECKLLQSTGQRWTSLRTAPVVPRLLPDRILGGTIVSSVYGVCRVVGINAGDKKDMMKALVTRDVADNKKRLYSLRTGLTYMNSYEAKARLFAFYVSLCFFVEGRGANGDLHKRKLALRGEDETCMTPYSHHLVRVFSCFGLPLALPTNTLLGDALLETYAEINHDTGKAGHAALRTAKRLQEWDKMACDGPLESEKGQVTPMHYTKAWRLMRHAACSEILDSYNTLTVSTAEERTDMKYKAQCRRDEVQRQQLPFEEMACKVTVENKRRKIMQCRNDLAEGRDMFG